MYFWGNYLNNNLLNIYINITLLYHSKEIATMNPKFQQIYYIIRYYIVIIYI